MENKENLGLFAPLDEEHEKYLEEAFLRIGPYHSIEELLHKYRHFLTEEEYKHLKEKYGK